MEGRAKILGATMPGNPHERLKEYQGLAEEARHHAAQASSPDDQSDWMQIAEEWEQLAVVAEQRENSSNRT
jgi:hypothetical protein